MILMVKLWSQCLHGAHSKEGIQSVDPAEAGQCEIAEVNS